MATRTGFPVAFGGFEHDDTIEVSSVAGARTPHINGLIVQAARGLGGRALIERRPRLALDYKNARTITHDYDRAVLGEGISTLLAVPVVVAGRSRGVLYAGSWSQTPLGDAAARNALAVASDLAIELRVREEVQHRLATTVPTPTPLGGAVREALREMYAELRAVSSDGLDSGIRDRLLRVEQQLARLSGGGDAPTADVKLSPRELDVLACAALGATNAEVAARLRLKEATVKSYLQSAMIKLDASTRHAAVARARQAGILP
ncbi:LuxR C-terminal-related transcriptional regulator [Microbacterium sp.]|uniref:LuxR C-terminal-related transcriptional regulator n=1 Tax=Microbacterium sp. TaxID=51671 RepID=UPI003A87A58A